MNGVELVSTTSDIGFVTNAQGVIHGWNVAAEECFDIPAEDAEGKPCWEVLGGKDAYGNDYCGANCPLMRMTLEGRQIRRCQLFFTGGDGISRPYSVITMLLRGIQPIDPAVVQLLHPAVWDRRSHSRDEPRISGNHQRGELTKRELEVLALLGRGESTAAIATSLRISPSTASNHVQHILFKLKVHSRLEAVSVGRQLRLL